MRTRVGYAGGTKKNPTYHSLGDHTESFQIDYDPTKTSYRTLLGLFWSCHNPCASAYSRQYMSAVFYHDEEQKRLAEETRDEQAKRGAVQTKILPLTEFTWAEDYHQKYYLRQDRELMKEFTAYYPDWREFTNSTAAAKANSYVSGSGSAKALRSELASLGLSARAGERLLERLGE